MNQIRHLLAVVVVLMLVATSTTPTIAQTTSLTTDSSVVRDAREYARDRGISLTEALRWLELQRLAGELGATLATKEQSRFAGLWIQHEPAFRIIVQLTQGSHETIRPYIEHGPLRSSIEIRVAHVPLAVLKADQKMVMQALQDVGVPANGGINIIQNRVEIYVTDRTRFEQALAKAHMYLPATVAVVTVDALASAEADIYGGLPVNGATQGCTSGFSARHPSSGVTGILTAGHCDDTLFHNSIKLPFWGQRIAGAYDVQFNAAGSYTPRNWVYDGVATRSITAKYTWDQQWVGAFICKYGRTTSYTCGYIVDKNYTYQGASSWIRVHRDGVNLSEGGDSGGPWFNGNIAYGLHVAGLGDDSLYEAINFAESGVNVLILTQ